MKLRLASLALLLFVVSAPAFAGTLYSNGPINGNLNGYTLGFGYVVSDTFTVSGASTVTGFDIGLWLFPSDTPVTVDWSIGTAAFGTDIASGTATLSNGYLYTNGYGYDVYNSTASGLNVAIGAGTYWFSLQNSTTAQGAWDYWDLNNGPSLAEHNTLGSIGSEAFNIYGTGGATTPEPGTIVMLASGVLGLGGVLRRKLGV